MHLDENGDIYQSNWFMAGNSFDLSGGDKTVIMKLVNGKYDESYTFDVSGALGLNTNVATVGWFYVGNGIGYMPIQLENEGNYFSENSWSLARIDVYNKTAVKLNVPMSMLLTYQNSVVVMVSSTWPSVRLVVKLTFTSLILTQLLQTVLGRG